MNTKILLVIIIAAVLIGGYALVNNETGRQEDTPPQTTQQESTDSLEVQSSKECSGKETPSLTEGPYYKAGSPLRTNLREDDTVGTPLTVTGYVFDVNCKPIPNSWLDFWQADGNGNYDNSGFKLRGHQFTDVDGKYVLETVVPARYSGRTAHIHVKVRASPNSPVLTSQLFFPKESQNQTDSIFDSSLVMELKDGEEGKTATFNFVLNVR